VGGEPQGGFFVWLKLPSGVFADVVIAAARQDTGACAVLFHARAP
jgi:DNA-binding transcriptional MocR family regulator